MQAFEDLQPFYGWHLLPVGSGLLHPLVPHEGSCTLSSPAEGSWSPQLTAAVQKLGVRCSLLNVQCSATPFCSATSYARSSGFVSLVHHAAHEMLQSGHLHWEHSESCDCRFLAQTFSCQVGHPQLHRCLHPADGRGLLAALQVALGPAAHGEWNARLQQRGLEASDRRELRYDACRGCHPASASILTSPTAGEDLSTTL